MNHGKVARDAHTVMSEADATAASVCNCFQGEHEQRAKYFKEGKIHKYSLKDTVSVEIHHKDVLTRHPQESWYIPGVIVGKIGQDVYAIQVGDNKILDRSITQLKPWASNPSRQEMTFEFTLGDPGSDEDDEKDDYTTERILADKPEPTTPRGRLYKIRWKGFAALPDFREPSNSLVPRYTRVWLNYLSKKGISLDVKDVPVNLIMHEQDRDDSALTLDMIVCRCLI